MDHEIPNIICDPGDTADLTSNMYSCICDRGNIGDLISYYVFVFLQILELGVPPIFLVFLEIL